ncbi:MAG: cytochrome oxidase subunit III [Chloroflexota bacterium]
MTDRQLQLIGWVLFIVCAVFYTAASVQDGNPLSIAGSVTFLVACFFFVVPLLRQP